MKKGDILPGVNKFREKEKFGEIEIKKGEIIAIVGLTGAGESQLLYDIEKIAQSINFLTDISVKDFLSLHL